MIHGLVLCVDFVEISEFTQKPFHGGAARPIAGAEQGKRGRQFAQGSASQSCRTGHQSHAPGAGQTEAADRHALGQWGDGIHVFG
ncbi:MAG: hypothetical protein BWY57_01607 [Betaproteobacteria bacterium ADurb.Bin341]|nr:MAG: hypothetical protein BWY57_01607 [Betaproteobacteria bacterium ADurb.Bin341]